MNMTLKDGTKIPIVDGSYTGAVVLIVQNRQALMDIWDQLTPYNLPGAPDNPGRRHSNPHPAWSGNRQSAVSYQPGWHPDGALLSERDSDRGYNHGCRVRPGGKDYAGRGGVTYGSN